MSSGIVSTPAVPEMLRDIKILPCKTTSGGPQIPLYNKMSEYDVKMEDVLKGGRTECLYAKDLEVIER